MKNLANYNSPENIGTTHWFRTLVSQMKAIGEYTIKNGLPTKEIQEDYGKQVYNICKDLIEWQETHQPLIQNLNEK